MGRGGWEEPRKLDNWHVDGDTFLHFLDSREQGLLITPIWNEEIKPHGGGTMIAPDGIAKIAKYLLEHPEGVRPGGFGAPELLKECNQFVELTGKRGDVVLAHPLMLYSASRNGLQIPRFITNPKVVLKDHFRFDRPAEGLSLVEQKTLRALGKPSLSYQPKGPREVLYPARQGVWEKILAAENDRLNAVKSNLVQFTGAHPKGVYI